MIEVSDRTRRGCSTAIVCAIMPPIDTPTTWALSQPRWSIRPKASSAMSLSVYGGRPPRAEERADQLSPRHPALDPGGPAGVAVVVAHDVEARLGEHRAQLRVPPGHRPAEAHHQHQRVTAGAAEGLVAQLHTGRDRGEQLLGDRDRHLDRLFTFCSRMVRNTTRQLVDDATFFRVNSPLGSFLLPTGFDGPAGLRALARESSTIVEAGRLIRRTRADRRARATLPYAGSHRDDRRTTRSCWCRASWPVTPPRRRCRCSCAARASAPTARRSTSTWAAPARRPTASSGASRRSRSGATARSRSSATASAACWPAVSPRADPTWSRASSAWAARCSPPAPSTACWRGTRRCSPGSPGWASAG